MRSCFRMGPMLMSVASDRPPMLPSSRQRSRLLPRWPTPTRIASREAVEVTCEAPDDAYLLLDWLNAVIYEMAVRRVVFGRFALSIIEGNRLDSRLGRASRPQTTQAGGRAQKRDLDSAPSGDSRRRRLSHAVRCRRLS